MSKQKNFELNFSLKGNASIQIGIYFLLAAYSIKQSIDGFNTDDSPFGMLSPEILEIFGISITFFTFLLSGLALYFKGRRKAKKAEYHLWNKKTRKVFWLIIFSFIGIFLVLLWFITNGFVNSITPAFLLLYGLLIFLNKNKKRKDLLVLTGVCLLFGVLCILIPSYWYSSLIILGVAHITYGVAVR